MREIKNIVVHCSGTPSNTTIESIKNYWKVVKEWDTVGYHAIIDADGLITPLLAHDQVSNGVRGHNANSVHVCYIGGKVGKDETIDTRTESQKKSLEIVLKHWKIKYPTAQILGHRDFAGVTKTCPNFDAKNEYSYL